MATPEQHTPEGRELQFATNHLGHFALTVGLHDALKDSGSARVAVLSSVGHVNGPVRFEDLDFTKEPYDPWLAYAQSKTANVLFAVEAAKRWAGDGIAVNALNPGRIRDTNLGRHLAAPPASFDPSGKTGVSEKNVAQGAATSVLLAASPLVEGVTGKYFEDCQEALPFTPGVRRGVADYALDPDNARRLWDVSVELTGIGRGPPNSTARALSLPAADPESGRPAPSHWPPGGASSPSPGVPRQAWTRRSSSWRRPAALPPPCCAT